MSIWFRCYLIYISNDRCADNLKSRMEDLRKEAIISREEARVGTSEILLQTESTQLCDGVNVGSEGRGRMKMTVNGDGERN